MKTLKLLPLCLFTILIGLATSCSKDDGPNLSLPPITETGANTFGCYVNGRLLVPRNGTGTFNSVDSGVIFWGSPSSRNYNEIDVHDYASEQTASINIHLLNLKELGEGTYIVNESNCQDQIDSPTTNNISCRVYDYEENIYKRYCSYKNSGEINITQYDSVSPIVSGTFSCRVRNVKNPDDEIEITDGRFDINTKTLPGTIFP